MAVAENGVASSGNHFETTDLERSNDDKSEKSSLKSRKNDVVVVDEEKKEIVVTDDSQVNNSDDDDNALSPNSGSENGKEKSSEDDMANGEGFKKEMRDLQEMLSKLNPMAKEFVPPSLVNNQNNNNNVNNFVYVNNFLIQPNAVANVNGNGNGNGNTGGRRRRNGYGQGKRRMNTRTSMAQREDVIRRTVYVSDIDHQVTEEQLASLFINCGQVVDCRICGDTNSTLRFAFVEFTDQESAKAALSLAGTVLGFFPVKVLPSKTAIAPVNPTFLPKSEVEREMCARTVYVTNIDKKVTQSDIEVFFHQCCGEVRRLRLLGDYHHSTRIAFVEFDVAESAIYALSCSGFVLGSLPIRVSPSKTPVRPRPPRSPLH